MSPKKVLKKDNLLKKISDFTQKSAKKKVSLPNPTMCSLVCRWRLQSALRVNQESFSIGPIIQL